MKRSVHGIGRIALYTGVVAAMLISIVPSSAHTASAQSSSRTINGHVVDGRFLQVWSSQGSEQSNVYVNGLPITDKRSEISLTDGKTYATQWFERARYEAHPENKAPYDVLLGLLGVTLTEGRPSIDPATKQPRSPADVPFVKIDKPADANGTTKVWFPETGHSVSGKILDYWNKYGGLQQFGFPLSEQFSEISPTDGKTYTVQYFERNRFELHPEKAAPYEVELGLLGVQQYKTTPLAGDQLPMAPPKGVTSTKDTLVFAMSQEPATLFCPFETAAVAAIVCTAMFNYSVNRDAKDNLWPGDVYYVPTLENGGAYYIGAGDDRHLVVKMKVRFGLKWSDGAPVNSNDWIYTYKMIMDPDSTIADRTQYEKYSSVDNPDPNTVIYNYMSYAQANAFYNATKDKAHFAYLKQFIDAKTPVVDPLYYASDGGAPLPSHILGKIPASKILESSYARNPVGDGPYKLSNWVSGSELDLVPNPNYTLTAPPLLKKVVVRIVSDTNQIIAQLKTGDLDGATSDAFAGPSPVLDTLGSSGQTVVYVPARVWEHIDLNLDKPYFADKAVRQAIITGINRQQLVDKIWLGKTVVMNTFLPPASWASMQNPDFLAVWGSKFPLKDYKFDSAKANQMLDAAGWAKGSDGIRTKGGVKMVFDYSTTAGNKIREQTTQLVAADLKNIGIQANLKYIPASTFFADDGTLAKRDFDMGEYAWILPVDPYQGSLYDSQNIPTADNNYSGQNYPGYKSAKFDQLSRASNAEIEQAKRAPLFAEQQQVWNDELPTLPLYARVNIEVHKSNLMNWDVSAGTTYNTYRIAAMYFK